MGKKKYRITFSDGPMGNRSESVDVEAESSGEALSIGWTLPQAKDRRYTEMAAEEWPDGPSTIGVEFETYDRVFKRTFTGRLFIRADSEKQAADYYRSHFEGKKSYCNYASRPEEGGKCSYGRIKGTYFAACPGWDFDATEDAA